MLFRSLLNMSRRFGNNLRQETDLFHSSGGGENQEERKGPSPVVSDNDTYFDEDQYPPVEDRYKQLEDRLSAMEIQKIPGLVLYPKICPPIFFKVLTSIISICSSLLKGCTFQMPPKAVKIRVLVLAKKLRFSRAQSSPIGQIGRAHV